MYTLEVKKSSTLTGIFHYLIMIYYIALHVLYIQCILNGSLYLSLKLFSQAYDFLYLSKFCVTNFRLVTQTFKACNLG